MSKCEHVFKFAQVEVNVPASGNFLEAKPTNAVCEKCGERIWAHGRNH